MFLGGGGGGGGGFPWSLQADAVNCHRLVTTLSVHLLSIPPFNTDPTYRYCRLYSNEGSVVKLGTNKQIPLRE